MPAEDEDLVDEFHDADVLLVVVRVLVPRAAPVMLREVPVLAVGVAQVDASSHDRSVHLRQVSHVGAVLGNLLRRGKK